MGYYKFTGGGMARIDKLEAADPKRREDLKAALDAGAFRLGAGSPKRILPRCWASISR
jgi:hypothetical protein